MYRVQIHIIHVECIYNMIELVKLVAKIGPELCIFKGRRDSLKLVPIFISYSASSVTRD